MKIRKTLCSLVLAGSLAFGCGAKPHTKSEKAWLATTIAGAVSDIATTKGALNTDKLREGNVFYGSYPKTEELILGRVIMLGLVYGMGRLYPKDRKNFYKIISGLQFGATAWNLYLINDVD